MIVELNANKFDRFRGGFAIVAVNIRIQVKTRVIYRYIHLILSQGHE
jgi:hypothetical protein